MQIQSNKGLAANIFFLLSLPIKLRGKPRTEHGPAVIGQGEHIKDELERAGKVTQ